MGHPLQTVRRRALTRPDTFCGKCRQEEGGNSRQEVTAKRTSMLQRVRIPPCCACAQGWVVCRQL
jgi:hypothetical protein